MAAFSYSVCGSGFLCGNKKRAPVINRTKISNVAILLFFRYAKKSVFYTSFIIAFSGHLSLFYCVDNPATGLPLTFLLPGSIILVENLKIWRCDMEEKTEKELNFTERFFVFLAWLFAIGYGDTD